jgi:mono/diheme cytochrome c family protein
LTAAQVQAIADALATTAPPPPPPTTLDGAALYASTCAGCHGPLASSSKRGRTAAQITAANMTKGLSSAQVQAVANALNF